MPTTLSVEQFRKGVSSGKVAPVYMATGGEPLYFDEVMLAARQSVDEATRDFNLDIFYADELDANQFASALGALPMMAERRVVLVKRAESLSTPVANYLLEYAKHPVESTLLVLIFDTASKKAWVQKLEKQVSVIKCDPPSGKKLQEWLETTAGELGITLDRDVIEIMTEGRQLRLIDLRGELLKASLLIDEGGMLTLPVLQQVWGIDPDVDIWQFFDKSAAGQRLESLRDLELLGEAMESGQGTGLFLSQVAKRLRMVWKEKRYDILRIPSASRTWPGTSKWQWGKAPGQLKALPVTAAERGLEDILRLDRTRKTQSFQDKSAIQQFIHRMSIARNGGRS